MLQTTITISGMAELQKRLDRLKNLAGMPEIVGKSIVAGVQRTFDRSENINTGQRWKPLKSRAGSPLLNTGGLKKSIRYVPSRKSVTIGTNYHFAHVHQKGMVIRPKKAKMLRFEVFGMIVYAKKVTIPRRPFLPSTNMGLERAAKGFLDVAFSKWVLDTMSRS